MMPLDISATQKLAHFGLDIEQFSFLCLMKRCNFAVFVPQTIAERLFAERLVRPVSPDAWVLTDFGAAILDICIDYLDLDFPQCVEIVLDNVDALRCDSGSGRTEILLAATARGPWRCVIAESKQLKVSNS